LPDERARIRLHDVVFDEVSAVVEATSDAAFPLQGQATSGAVRERLDRYESICQTLVKMLAVGGYWGPSSTASCGST
jgi:hypothetical protein